MNDASSSPHLPSTPRRIHVDELRALCAADGDRRHGCRILDLRDANAPSDPPVRGSAWIPWEERIPAFLLPRRGLPLVVVAPTTVARHRAAALSRAGWPTSWFDGVVPGDCVGGRPGGAAWDVDPFLRGLVDALPPEAAGPVLDLGSGSSREGVFLAQRGHRVSVLDRLPDALDLAVRRAALHGVAVTPIERRVRRPDDLPAGPWSIVLCFRFLDLEVLPGLAPLMAPGGALVLKAYGHDPGRAELGPGPLRIRDRLTSDGAREILERQWQFRVGPDLRIAQSTQWLELMATVRR